MAADVHLSMDAIGLQSGTDKASSDHDYLSFYERFFEKLRGEPIKILEVGVLNGASLKLWENYFPQATVIGADIDPTVSRFETDRTRIEILDQSNIQNLVDLGIKHGPFDIIIEDGSHLWEHQMTSLKALFPFLRNRGYYVVEDLQTNFGELAQHYRGNATISCVEYLKKLVDLRVAHEQINIAQEDDAFLRTYGRSVGFIAFYRHACLIEKTLEKPTRKRGLLAEPLVAFSDVPCSHPFELTAHVGNFGDVRGGGVTCINVDEGDESYIQGFALTAPEALAKQIRYRARLGDGSWTSWMPGNAFVGSRGQRANLTGFSLEVSGDLRDRHDIIVAGAFSGSGEVVSVGNGQHCFPTTSTGFLRGMQLLMKVKRPSGALASDTWSSHTGAAG
jgi:hypothetical protein